MNNAVTRRTGGRITTQVDAEALVQTVLLATTCAYCQGSLDTFGYAVDHVTPLSRGSPHALENLVVACEPCNGAKGDLLVNEFCQWLTGVARCCSPHPEPS